MEEVSETSCASGLKYRSLRSLLGGEYLNVGNAPKPAFWEVDGDLTAITESRVIEQDCFRTRSDESYYATSSMRCIMKEALLRYCGYYKVKYMQGLNEVLAPFLLLAKPSLKNSFETSDRTHYVKHTNSPTVYPTKECSGDACILHHRKCIPPTIGIDGQSYGLAIECSTGEEEDVVQLCQLCTNCRSFNICLALFEKFVERMSPVLFSTEGVEALQIQLASLHQLLYYFDAGLAALLCKHGMTTDIYAPSWLITVFSRRVPVHAVLKLWDVMLGLGRPHLVLFIGIALLLKKKNHLMSLPSVSIPQALVQIQIEGEEEVDDVVKRAIYLESSSPPSAVEEIRAFGFDASFPESERAATLLDMMYRPCLLVDAADVATVVMKPPLRPSSSNPSSPRLPSLRQLLPGSIKRPDTLEAQIPADIVVAKEKQDDDVKTSSEIAMDAADDSGAPISSEANVDFNQNIGQQTNTSPLPSLKELPITKCSSGESSAAGAEMDTAYLIIDCRQDSKERTRCFIEGSLIVRPDIVEEIRRAAFSKEKSTMATEPDLGPLSPTAAATLALLWSCRADNVHLAIVGSDHSVSAPTSSSSGNKSDAGTTEFISSRSSKVSTEESERFSISGAPTPTTTPVPSAKFGDAGTGSVKTAMHSRVPSTASVGSQVPSSRESPRGNSVSTKQPNNSTASLGASASSKQQSQQQQHQHQQHQHQLPTPAQIMQAVHSSSASVLRASPPEIQSSQVLSDAEKKRIAKKKYEEPFHNLATALMILGFSHVSVVRGASLPPGEENVPEKLIENNLGFLVPSLQSKIDGFAALVYQLLQEGATVSGAVVHVPQNSFIARKVHKFTLSGSRGKFGLKEHNFAAKFRNPEKQKIEKRVGSSGGNSSSNKGGEIGTRQSLFGAKPALNDTVESRGREVSGGLRGLESMLRVVGGMRDDFVETILLPQMQHKIGMLSSFTRLHPDEQNNAATATGAGGPSNQSPSADNSGLGSSSSADSQDLGAATTAVEAAAAAAAAISRPQYDREMNSETLFRKLKKHSNAQSVRNGRMVYADVSMSTAMLPSVMTDIQALEYKFRILLNKGVSSTVATSSRAVGELSSKIDQRRIDKSRLRSQQASMKDVNAVLFTAANTSPDGGNQQSADDAITKATEGEKDADNTGDKNEGDDDNLPPVVFSSDELTETNSLNISVIDNYL